jgi:hypothetical protein
MSQTSMVHLEPIDTHSLDCPGALTTMDRSWARKGRLTSSPVPYFAGWGR